MDITFNWRILGYVLIVVKKIKAKNFKNKKRRYSTWDAMNEKWSAPLQQLMDEHVLLRADMDVIYEIIEEIEFESGNAVFQRFTELAKLISIFTAKLRAHSKQEEEGLFPMMTRNLSENDRTIDEMEREHEKAEKHLQDFLSEAGKAGTAIDENDIQWITTYAFQAHATLTQHFAKEEKVLFPLAESLLSIEEKTELERLIHVQ
jgi:regulator of cell morphogenesis and NO signaling